MIASSGTSRSRARKAARRGGRGRAPRAELRVEILNRSAGPDGRRALKGPRLGRAERALKAGAGLAARRFGGDEGAFGGAVNVVWLRDGEMRRLNLRFCGLSRTTDVLAYSTHVKGGGWTDPETGLPAPGEIACNLELAGRAAREHGNSIEAEAVLYAVHGLAHLLGGEDDTPSGRRAMREVEVAALAAAGLRVRGGEWD